MPQATQNVAALEKTTVLDSEAFPPATGSLSRFGDYELISEIARGGMGVVYKARQLSLNRLVAVKMILNARFNNPEYILRFRAEAEAAAHLRHPNIVGIYEIGEAEGQHFFSMEYVEGRNLSSLVREQPLAAVRAAEYVKIIAEAIHYAHQRGFVHRDLKPSNVLIDLEGELRITDFGLAKRLADSDLTTTDTSQLTVSGQVLGSPSYMPPEQAAGLSKAVDARSDVYSLGAILYHLLVGRPPFSGETIEATLVQVLQMDPPPPRLLNPGIPRDLETITLRCLEKHRAQRYQSAREVAEDLGRFLGHEPIHARPLGWAGRTGRWCQRKPALAAALASVALVFAAGLTGVLWQWARAEANARSELQQRRQAEQASVRALLGQARSGRLSGYAGQRFLGLEALGKAAAIQPSVELRNEAIACSALADLRVGGSWPGFPAGSTALAFSPDQQEYAVSASGQGIRRYAWPDHRELSRWNSNGQPLATFLLFHPAGTHLLAVPESAGAAELWDCRKGVSAKLPAEPLAGRTDGFSADGQQLAVAFTNGMLVVLDVATLHTNYQVFWDRPASALQLDPAGKRLAAASQSSLNVLVHDLVGTNRTPRKLFHSHVVAALAWHPGGSLLATASGDRRIHLWNLDTGGHRILEGHSAPVAELVFNRRGGLLAAMDQEGTLRLWDHVTGRELVRLDGPAKYVNPAFSPDDSHLVGRVVGSEVQLLEVAPQHEWRSLVDTAIGTRVVRDMALSPGGRFIALAFEDGVRLVDLAAGGDVHLLPVGSVDALGFDPANGDLVTSGFYGLQRLPCDLDPLSNNEILWVGPPRTYQIEAGAGRMAWNRDGTVWAVTAPGGLLLMDRTQLEPRRVLNARSGLGPVAVSSSGRWVATANPRDATVDVWSAADSALIASSQRKGVAELLFAPDDRWLLSRSLNGIELWDSSTWREPTLLAGDLPTARDGAMAVSPDGSLLAVVRSPTEIDLYHGGRRELLATLESPQSVRPVRLQFSADGTRLFCAGLDVPLSVWDLSAVQSTLASYALGWNAGPPVVRTPALPSRSVRVSLMNRRPFEDGARILAELKRVRVRSGAGDADFWKHVAELNRLLGQDEAAVEALSRALATVGPEQKRRTSLLSSRVEKLIQLGREAEALVDFEALQAEAPMDTLLCRRIAFLRFLGADAVRDDAAGRRQAQTLMDLAPEDSKSQLWMALAEYRSGRFEAALGFARRAEEGGSADVKCAALVVQSMCRVGLHQPADAWALFDEARRKVVDLPAYRVDREYFRAFFRAAAAVVPVPDGVPPVKPIPRNPLPRP